MHERTRPGLTHQLSRRALLRVGARAGVGAAGLALVGCGGDDDDEAQAPEAVRQATPERAAESSEEAAAHDVIVVGGGIAGLTAAFILADEYDVLLLEREDRVGGRTSSGRHGGFTYAQGTEYVGTPAGTLATIINRLGLEPVEIPAPGDILYADGKFYFGEDGIALLSIERTTLGEYNRFVRGIQESAALYEDVPEFDLASPLAKLDDVTAAEWFSERGFPDFYADRYNVTARGLFGANLGEISALSSIPEIAFDYEGATTVTDVSDLENTVFPNEATDTFTFVTGITEVTDGLAAALGERVQREAAVEDIVQTDDGVRVTWIDASGARHSRTAGAVVLTVPAPIALRLAPAALSAEQTGILEQVPYAPFVTVALFSDEPIFDAGFDLAVPNDFFFTDLYDATWVQRRFDRSLRKAETFIASAYIAGQSYTDPLLEMSDGEILDNLLRDLDRIFPGAGARVTGTDIQRFPYAYPVLTPGAYQRLTRLHEITAGPLFLAGDYTVYPTFEAAADSGLLAADRASDFLDAAT